MSTARQDDPTASGGLTPVMDLTDALADWEDLRAMVGTLLLEAPNCTGDYGLIPGTKQKRLLKPGAIKICRRFGLVPSPEYVERTLDWEQSFFCYEIRMRLIRRETGVIEGEGIGSANSREGCFMETQWYNGNGAPPDADNWKRINTEDGPRYKRLAAPLNPADTQGKVLNRALTRALRHAVDTLVCGDGLFTIYGAAPVPATRQQERAAKSTTAAPPNGHAAMPPNLPAETRRTPPTPIQRPDPPAPPAPPPVSEVEFATLLGPVTAPTPRAGDRATAQQIQAITNAFRALHWTQGGVNGYLEKAGVKTIADLPASQAADVLVDLQNRAA